MSDTEKTPANLQVQETNETTASREEPVETFDREYVEKLRKENAKYRNEAKQNAEKAEKARLESERQKLDEVERLKAEKADAEKRAQAIEQRAVAAERRAALAGKVADPAAALKLLDPDKHLNGDEVNIEALLKDYPFLAPRQESGVYIPAARTAGKPALTDEDIKKMTPEQVNERWAEIQAHYKSKR